MENIEYKNFTHGEKIIVQCYDFAPRVTESQSISSFDFLTRLAYFEVLHVSSVS